MPATARAKKRRVEEESRHRPDGGSPDRISHLPEDVVGSIITRLPMEEGARTRILSRKWRHLWRDAAPLNLEADVLPGGVADEAVLSELLGDHRGPMRRFCLRWRRSLKSFGVVDDALLRLESFWLGNLHEFDIFYDNGNLLSYADDVGRIPYPLPKSVHRCSPTLRVLHIRLVSGLFEIPPEIIADALVFPHLRQLTLYAVRISHISDIHAILSSCPVLESLVLHVNKGSATGRWRFQISSPTLRSLALDSCFFTREELVIEDAPLLETLITTITIGSIIQAPKLKTLGPILCQNLSYRTANVIRTVKNLSLMGPKMGQVAALLKCSPCIENLRVVGPPTYDGNVQYHLPLECLDHLKTLEVANYYNKENDFSFVKFCLLNARVLEFVNLVVDRERKKKKSPGWKTKLLNWLELNNSASPDVKVNFLSEYVSPWSFELRKHIKHIHELYMDNPFDVSSCTCREVQ